MVDFNVDVAAMLSAVGGAIVGAVVTTFKSGRAWERVEGTQRELKSGQDRIEEKMTIISDELARRITTLENRVQYDGYYDNPRIKRDPR